MLTLALVLLHLTLPAGQARPDFSGTWIFDQAKSMEQPGPDGRIVLAAMLGDEFIATQDAAALTLTIKSAGQTVTATYRLDGVETRNLSPGDVVVKSRASWDGRRLVIHSTSEGMDEGRPVTIETRRALWTDDKGFLIIERTGAPAGVVTPSRSVYRRRPPR